MLPERKLTIANQVVEIDIETVSTSLASSIVRLSAFNDFRRFVFLLIFDHFLAVPSILGEDGFAESWAIHGHA